MFSALCSFIYAPFQDLLAGSDLVIAKILAVVALAMVNREHSLMFYILYAKTFQRFFCYTSKLMTRNYDRWPVY